MKGVILAAGEGSRIRSVTYGAFPKELLPIGIVPTIRFPLEALRLEKIKNVLVVISAQTKHGIIDGLQAGRRFGMEINYAVQEQVNGDKKGLGAAILSAKSWVGNEDFVVACGDSILCDSSSSNPLGCLRSLVDLHKNQDSIATILAYPLKNSPERFGVLKFRNYTQKNGVMFGDVERMVEKPTLSEANLLKPNGFYYIASGYYAFKPSIFSYIEKTKPGVKDEIQITDAMELAVESGERVSAVVHAKCKNGDLFPCEYWDVGIPSEYKNAVRYLLEKDADKWLI